MIEHTLRNVAATPDPELMPEAKPPTVVMAWSCANTSVDTTVRSPGHGGFGFSVGTPDEITVASGDEVFFGFDTSGSAIIDANWGIMESAPNIPARQLVMTPNCRPNGFYWDKDNGLYSAQYMSWLSLIGGASFQAHVGTLQSPTTAEGSISRVVTGVGFEPQVVILLWQKTNTITPFNTEDAGGPAFGMGACSDVTDPGQSWAFQTTNDYIVGGGDTTSIQKQGVSFTAMGTFGTGVQCDGLITSFDPDGFTVEFNRADRRIDTGFGHSINGRMIGFLAMRDDLGGFRVGNGLQPGTGLQSFSGLGFDPQAVLLAHGNCDSLDTMYTPRGPFHIGGFDGDSSSSMLSGRIFGRRLYSNALTFADDGTTVVAEADGQLDTNGFSLDWTLSDSVARPFGWVAMATEGTPPDCPDFQQIYRLLKP